ncbi:uncharacterized protein LOC124915852 [Impatiens glandulifera]|uniref:uncharacterized protein LOC124915852 n=1 Tax=Impatiens glandulifera TaxID=253017 RepID=UPI001FB08954|nr:uncharacterized protein LOC124915852 [Impatiens glandulifera]XP_047312567.1 uncharacterized protein LOC124915852 [Impatiens glandulifera]XP_047312574.1 uncharacterized protein LOC124915852 [Impatiens glandulifera]
MHHHSLSSSARRTKEVYDPLKLEKHKFSSSNNAHSKNNSGNKAPKCSETKQKQQAERKSFDQEELVKYMSRLPNYLEKGQNLPEKALNVGVLDWRHLQKWQYNQKSMPSSSNSSILPTEKIAMHSSRGHSWSPARQRFPPCTLQSQLILSKNEFRPHSAKGLTENTSKWQEHDQSGKILKGQLKELKYIEKIQKDEDCKASIDSAAALASTDPSSKEPNRMSFSKSSAKDVINHSNVHLFLPREEHGIEHQQIQNCNSVEKTSIKFPSISRSISPSPSRCRNSDPKKPTALPINSNVLKYEESTPRRNLSEKTKLRSPSPTRRLIMGMAKIGRISFSKDGPDDTARSKIVDSMDTARTKQPNGTSRSQSSPLRRLLDPWLRPKPSDSDSMSIDRPSKSSHGRIESSFPEHSKFRTSNVSGLNHNEQQVSALLQISIKNGLPLFTFAIENSNDILAATRRKMNASMKDENSYRWIYTFFNVQEVRKKTGWIKGKGGYIPNPIAQMIVSDTHFSMSTTREFVLFSTGVNNQSDDLQAKEELASIVIKFQRNTGINNTDNAHLAGTRTGSGFLFNTTHVVLPGGVHGIPSGGEPSPLIERWRSGGRCDCGGWDMGCKIRVLANQIQQQQPSKISNASRTGPHADRFELFSQGEQQDDKSVLSLSPFRDGIFSVEFSSPLTCIQAFSICIAVVNSIKLNELQNSTSRLFEAKCCDEIPSNRNIGIRSSNRTQRELAPSYASYPPPLSPFGRA